MQICLPLLFTLCCRKISLISQDYIDITGLKEFINNLCYVNLVVIFMMSFYFNFFGTRWEASVVIFNCKYVLNWIFIENVITCYTKDLLYILGILWHVDIIMYSWLYRKIHGSRSPLFLHAFARRSTLYFSDWSIFLWRQCENYVTRCHFFWCFKTVKSCFPDFLYYFNVSECRKLILLPQSRW